MARIAVMTAAICVATILSIPFGNGYIHLADALCMLAGIYLGPLFGALAAALGSSLSDLLLGYVPYIPATFIIKGLVALIVGIFYNKTRKNKFFVIPSAILSEALMVLGYFLYEALIYANFASALFGVWGNAVQAISSVIIFVFVILIYEKKKKNKRQ